MIQDRKLTELLETMIKMAPAHNRHGRNLEIVNIASRYYNKIFELGYRKVEKCKCLIESDAHGVYLIESPTGVRISVGGADHPDRYKFCPYCGGRMEYGRDKEEHLDKVEKLRAHILEFVAFLDKEIRDA